jgi:hypothetical protein
MAASSEVNQGATNPINNTMLQANSSQLPTVRNLGFVGINYFPSQKCLGEKVTRADFCCGRPASQ